MEARITERKKLGVIIGNRGDFPDRFYREGRAAVLEALKEEGVGFVTLPEGEGRRGCVGSPEEARRCAELFDAHRHELDGILVSLPDFSDERAAADAIRGSRLDVPVLVHAVPDEKGKMTRDFRRDTWWGKISVCNSLRQYGIRYSLTANHVQRPESEAFRRDLRDFRAACAVVDGLRGMRVGMFGARPAAFNTVRCSEKLLERSGISVVTLDLSEVFYEIRRMGDGDPETADAAERIRAYLPCAPEGEALTRMAKLLHVVEECCRQHALDAVCFQCWSILQKELGISACTVLAMLGSRGISGACETDVLGAVSMRALALASGVPSVIADWNNNDGEEPDRCVLFHCSNFPRETLAGGAAITCKDPGGRNPGAIAGRLRPGGVTFCRISTDDTSGRFAAYVGEGELLPDTLDTFGGYVVARIPDLEGLTRYICRGGFEHHVALSHSSVARPVKEAFERYLGWPTYRHGAGAPD